MLLELDSGKRDRFLEALPDYDQAFFTFLPDEQFLGYRTDDTRIYRVGRRGAPSRMKRASDILAKLLDENSRAKAQSYSSVFGGWRDLAGLSLADHSRVYEIRHGNLFVEVDHNGWMQILQLRKPRILNRLRTRYPELGIRDLKVRVNPSMGPRPAEPGESARETGPAEPTPAVPAVSAARRAAATRTARSTGSSPG